jgi:hypothetical protein
MGNLDNNSDINLVWKNIPENTNISPEAGLSQYEINQHKSCLAKNVRNFQTEGSRLLAAAESTTNKWT